MSEVAKDVVGRFIDAAVSDQTNARAILREHPDVLEGRWIHYETPLHFLAVEGFEEGVRFLAELGANVNATNEFGDTALVDVAVLSSDRKSRVPTTQARRQAYDRIAAILLEHGADPNVKSVTHDNVLDIAVTSGNSWLVDLLMKRGARADYETYLGTTIADAIPSDPEQRGPILEILTRYGINPARG